jgi:hypothetical protein
MQRKTIIFDIQRRPTAGFNGKYTRSLQEYPY